MFCLIINATLEPLRDDQGVRLFKTGKEAQKFADDTGVERALSVRPYTPPSAEDWRERERNRLRDGIYKALPDWLDQYMYPTHFAHVSKDRLDRISYTKDDDKGARDIQTRISVAGYLEKYQSNRVDASSRASLVKRFLDWSATIDIAFARTPDEIEHVYTFYDHDQEGLRASCMGHTAGNYSSPVHPVRVYGAGDLCVAYTQNAEGRTTSRALCFPAKLTYSRVYGGSTTCQRLHDALKELGYRKSNCFYGGQSGCGPDNFSGARLLAIPARGDRYVAPYIDDISGADLVRENGKHVFVLTEDGEYTFNQTNGLSGETEPEEPEYNFICEHCAEGYPDDEAHTVNTTDGAETWCDCCTDRRAFHCHGSEEYYSRADFARVVVNGEMYEQGYANARFSSCEACDERVANVTKVTTGTGRHDTARYCADCIASDTFRCVVDGERYAHAAAAPGTLRRVDPDDDSSAYVGRFIGNDAPDGAPYHCADPAQTELTL